MLDVWRCRSPITAIYHIVARSFTRRTRLHLIYMGGLAISRCRTDASSVTMVMTTTPARASYDWHSAAAVTKLTRALLATWRLYPEYYDVDRADSPARLYQTANSMVYCTCQVTTGCWTSLTSTSSSSALADWSALHTGWAQSAVDEQVASALNGFNGTFDAPAPPSDWMRVCVCVWTAGHWTFCAQLPLPQATSWHVR